MFARFAQEYGGQKLHIVKTDVNSQSVENYAICGRNCSKRGNWRMTINMPLASLCGNCKKLAKDVKIINF